MNPSRRSHLRETMRADSDRLTALAQRHGTPLLVLQPHLVARRYRQLAENLRGFRLHYAVKALPHPLVLSTIAVCGGGFDVASDAEVDLLQQLSVPMDRCIHTNPIKKPADIDRAYAAGIRTFVVESLCEADEIQWPTGRHRIACPAGVSESGSEVRYSRRSSGWHPPRPRCWSST